MNALQKIETLEGMLCYDKATILLVHGNLKPSTMVVIEGEVYPVPGKKKPVDPARITQLSEALNEMGLSYKVRLEVIENGSRANFTHAEEVAKICIAHDQATADRLSELFAEVNAHHTEIGTLLGYPATAVAAFPGPELLPISEHPLETDEVSAENMFLLGHRLSKAHWRDEVKYLEESGNYLKSVSPQLYDEIMNDNKLPPNSP